MGKHSVFAAAFLSAALSAVCLPAQVDQGDILARVRAISIQPSVSAGGTLGSIGTGVNNAIVPELDFVYMVRPSIGIELIFATSRHQVTSSAGAIGGVNVLPPTLLLQYYFNAAGKVRPYIGASVNYTLFYNNGVHAEDTPVSIKNSSFGPALQAGVDVQVVARNLFVNFDIKKIWMRTSASDRASLGSLKIDPLVWSALAWACVSNGCMVDLSQVCGAILH